MRKIKIAIKDITFPEATEYFEKEIDFSDEFEELDKTQGHYIKDELHDAIDSLWEMLNNYIKINNPKCLKCGLLKSTIDDLAPFNPKCIKDTAHDFGLMPRVGLCNHCMDAKYSDKPEATISGGEHCKGEEMGCACECGEHKNHEK